jgi:hypothetical protein
MFPGKTLRKTNTKKKKVTPKLEDDTKTEMAIDKPSASTQPDAPDECGTEKTIRKSTRTSVIVRQAEREAIRAEKEATAKVSSIYEQPFHFYKLLIILLYLATLLAYDLWDNFLSTPQKSLSSLLATQNFEFPYQPSFLSFVPYPPIPSNLRLNNVKWREKRHVYPYTIFFAKESWSITKCSISAIKRTLYAIVLCYYRLILLNPLYQPFLFSL